MKQKMKKMLSCLLLTVLMTIFVTGICVQTNFAEEKQIVDIQLVKAPIPEAYIEGYLFNMKSYLVGSIALGADLKIVYSDATEVILTDRYAWEQYGINVMLKNKETQEIMEQDNKMLLPGSYELDAYYNDISVKITDFVVKAPLDIIEKELTLEQPVEFESSDDVRHTYTKFVANDSKKYTFKLVDTGGNPTINFIIRDEKGTILATSYSKELKAELQSGQFYCLEVSIKGGFKIFATDKDIILKKITGILAGNKSVFKLSDIRSYNDLINTIKDNMRVKVQYSNAPDELYSLKEATENRLLDLNFQNEFVKGQDVVNPEKAVETGIYNFKYWAWSDKTENEPEGNLQIVIYNGYNDVSDDAWFTEYVSEVSARKLMTGLTNEVFGPSEKLARAQFATILHRAAGSPSVSYEDKFPDIPKGEFYTEPVLWASKQDVEIITGYSNGNFGPADFINREQIATMMYRYAKFMEYDISNKADITKYPDNMEVSSFAKEAIEWAVGAGLITGDQGKINPQGNANRAECAAILSRFMEKYNM